MSEAQSAKRVLIVEDDPDAREALCLLLELYGHDVQSAGSGAEAVSSAASGAAEIVLIDIGLPDFDGHEVARRIRAQQSGVPPTLVALTGYSDPAEREIARQAGFDDYLVKPVASEALKKVLSR